MELRHVLAVLMRRWPLLAIVIGLAALASALGFLSAAPTYTTSVNLLVRQLPPPDNVPYYTFSRYYNWFANEFLVDDYTLIVGSRAFAEEVAAQLRRAAPGKYGNVETRNTTTDQVYGTISGDRQHRILTVSVQTGSYGLTPAIANAAADVLTASNGTGVVVPTVNGQPVSDEALFALLDPSNANRVASDRRRGLIDAAVRLALGIIAALALVVLVEYFDDRLRDEADAERLVSAPVLGRIPR